MALEKTVIEMTFDKGLEQKVAHEIAPDGLIETLENVDLSQVGKYVRRKGYSIMTTTSLGPDSPPITFSNVTKLASREDQLIAVSSNSGALGSGGGAGSSGDTVFGYSESLVGWKAETKIPRPTLDTIYSFAQDSQGISALDSAKSGNITLIAFRRSAATGQVSNGIFAHAVDVSSGTVVANTVPIEIRTPLLKGSVKCVAMAPYIYIFWISDANPGTDQVYAVRYDSSANTFGAAAAVTGFANDVNEFDVCTDGTNIYLATAVSTTSLAWAQKLNSSLVQVISDSEALAGTPTSCSCSTANGVLHLAFNATGGAAGVYFAQASTTNPMTIGAFADVMGAGLAAIPTQVLVASFSATEAWVFGWVDTIAAPTGPTIHWIRVNPTSTATPSGNIRTCAFVKPFSKPFFLSSRLYIGLAGYDGLPGSKSDYGYALCELDVSATGSVTSYATPMPTATWSTDVAYPFPATTTSSPNGCMDTSSTYYIATATIFRSFDTFFAQTSNSVVGAYLTFQETGFRLMALNFADSKRWQTAKHGDSIVFAGGLPYCFDGLHAHEAGFIWRPSILSTTRNTGTGILPVNDTVNHRVTYEYWDSIQRRWNSVTNIATESQTACGTDTASITLTVRPPTVSAKPRGGAYFFGLIRVMLWRSKSSAPSEYIYLDSLVVEPFRTTTVSFTDNHADSDIAANERMYTYGGELENYGPPPCRAIVAHRDRIFALNTETNELWYTKPLINGRGVEWSRFQKLPLFEKGMALGAIESGLLVFTDKGIYALQGSGPSITGLPPDAFSKLYQLSNEIGCSEQCAAFSTPVGVIFRARQGLWLVDKSMSIKYIGGSVESFMSTVSEMISGDVDEKKGVVRFLVRQAGVYFTLNYWYDTNRWSYDTMGSSTANSAVVHKGVYHQSRDTGIFKASTTSYADNGVFYAMKVRTHWLRFGNMSSVKRVWRVLTNVWVRARIALTVKIERNFGVESSNTEFFDWTNNLINANGATAQPRVHLAKQKATAIRITLTEGQDSTADTQGLEFLGLGFELGMKRGAVKMRQELSA